MIIITFFNYPVSIDFVQYVSGMEIKDGSHLKCDCPAYNNLRENLFETLNRKMQINLSSLSQEIQTFTILNPDSSECYQDIALFVYSCIR